MHFPRWVLRISPRSEWQILDPDIRAFGISNSVRVTSLFIICSNYGRCVEPSAAALLARRRTDQQLSRTR